MSEKRCRIVFDGALQTGVDITTAKLNLAQLFKCDVAAIEHLFSGEPVALKRDLSEAAAQTYLDALSKTGIQARIEAEPAVELDLSEVSPVSAASAVTPEQSPYAPPRAPADETLPEFSQLKLFSVQGRIGRLRYIAWTLVTTLIIGAVTSLLGLSLWFNDQLILAGIVFVGAVLVYLYVYVTISVQRLHDLGWSGWLCFLHLVPLLDTLLLIVQMAVPGNATANRYGAPPPPNSVAVKVLCALWLAMIAVFFVSAVTGDLGTLIEEQQSAFSLDHEPADTVDTAPADDPAPVAPPPVDYEHE
ncbi:Uncharacterized membrane protein YhaH, DUF805 family [Pseudomonas sp. ok272]|uniref:DUF805 domain-containing protein n=1 Tax=unclassified Pseudomonas TaxID=196821 RepID=UPI0008B48520|nr:MULTISPECIES: DUF805 domain-containing protein [unclassified Pseudomonas]SEM76995.1 Uncharacterized membrane protein YhaH, DUF805 family [Pseudomonas sp. ok272]SFM71274.1 Uncharacterized membrane protein YhaH, DUF805 family [Pseudomonas sp. ok602]